MNDHREQATGPGVARFWELEPPLPGAECLCGSVRMQDGCGQEGLGAGALGLLNQAAGRVTGGLTAAGVGLHVFLEGCPFVRTEKQGRMER